MLVATTNDLPGYRVTKHLGLVRGITVRSRSVIGNLGGTIQSVFGGKLSIYVDLAERAREEAYEHMVEHARGMGANAVIAFYPFEHELAATGSPVSKAHRTP